MPFVPAPGVVQVRLQGTVVGIPYANVLHFSFGTSGAPWSQTQVNLLANNIVSAWSSHIQPLQCSAVTITGGEVTDLTNATPATANITGGPVTGTMVGSNLDSNTAICVNFPWNRRARGGHPRIYLGPPAASASADGRLYTTAFQASVTNGMQAFINQINTTVGSSGGLACVQCAPAYTYLVQDDTLKKKYIRTKNGFIGIFPLGPGVCKARLCTQRRRLGA